MRRITVKQEETESRIKSETAKEKFIRSCVVRNLSSHTVE